MNIKTGYKQTEIGVIPDDWEVKKLGDILKVIGGGAFKSADSQSSGIKWLKIANVDINRIVWNDESYLPSELIKNNENFLLNSGDYVIALTRPILGKKLKIAQLNNEDVPALLNQRVGKIAVENGNDLNFTYFLFQKDEIINALAQSMAGTDPPNLSNRGIYNIDCAVPSSKQEQTAIASALSDVDALMGELDKLIAKKRDIKQATMQQLLTGKKRLAGFSGEWEVKRLGDIAEIDPENLNSSTSPEYEFRYISLEDVDSGTLTNTTEMQFKNAPSRARRKIRKFDVLVSTVRPNLQSHLIIQNEVTDWVCSTGFSVVRCKNANAAYIFNHLFASTINRQIDTLITGSNYPAINSSDVKNLLIPIPPTIEEQIAIATILSDMDAEINALQQKRDKTAQLKQGMMQELLTGRIRLSIKE